MIFRRHVRQPRRILFGHCSDCGGKGPSFRLEEILGLFRASLPGDNQVTLTFTPWEKPIEIRADAQLLRQIMQNLLGNAMDSVAGQGSITVRTTAHLNAAIISVTDNGPGIAPAVQADLFKEGTSTKKGQHSGLGLAIVHRLMHRMGGSVACESSRGTTVFSLTFPT